ncbi:MAG: glycosyltransferase [Planctomycetota bacterium]
MFYVPGMMKRLDAAFYTRAFERGLARAMANAARLSSAHRQSPANRQSSIPNHQLIEAHFVWPDGVGAWRVARNTGIPFVCTIRGKLVSQIADPSKRRLIRQMLRDADALIAVSQSLANLANEVAGRDLGVRVIPNGVDTQMFRRFGKTGHGSSEDARYVISVGHIQELKGFHRLVEIWPEVRQRAGDVRLRLVGGAAGEPAYERRLRRQIDGSGLGPCEGPSGAVTLLGRRRPDEIAELLNAADLFVLASRSEGWNNAIVEALACGCPVVATDVGGNREIVNDPALGSLALLGDRAALTKEICRALARDWDREAIAAVGGQRDWQQVALECVDVFKSVLSAKA